MTTDEALEYCKRFDDPKLQSQMGTDFANATGTVGALLALRAELTTLRGKLRELDAYLADGEGQITRYINADKRAGRSGDWHSGRLDIVSGMREKLRELGLLEVNDDVA